MSTIKWRLYCYGLLICMFCFPPASVAADSSVEEWEFSLAPFYLWAVNIDGDISSGSKALPVDVEFDDIFDSLEAAFIVHFEGVYKGKWGFLTDINYLGISNQLTLPMGIKQDVDLDLAFVEFAGFHRTQYGMHFFDIIGGIRYINIDNKVSITNGPTLVDGNKNWLDPLIGGRWTWAFSEKWNLVVQGDIGGFGVGSDFAWQTLGLVTWKPFEHVSFIAGVRALYMDYEDDSEQNYFKYDATAYGPVLGVKFTW